jgi:hypothetical protein
LNFLKFKKLILAPSFEGLSKSMEYFIFQLSF